MSRPLIAGPTPVALWEDTIFYLPLLITSAYALVLTATGQGQEAP